jgi:hypothetical protein
MRYSLLEIDSNIEDDFFEMSWHELMESAVNRVDSNDMFYFTEYLCRHINREFLNDQNFFVVVDNDNGVVLYR